MKKMPAKIETVLGDITKQTDVEAIVNAANETLLGGGGVDGAIHKAAGPELQAECRTLGGCCPGEAKITNAYALPANYVIHTVGPRWRGGQFAEREILKRCYASSLDLARKNGIRTIAFPSISTGVFHFPLKEAAAIAADTVVNFLSSDPGSFDLVRFVLFDEKTRYVYACAFENLGYGETTVPDDEK